MLDSFLSIYTSAVSLLIAFVKDTPDPALNNKDFLHFLRVLSSFHFLQSLVLWMVGAPHLLEMVAELGGPVLFLRDRLIQPVGPQAFLGV